MKIKTDFITNSSSTMFIFFIPESFELDDHDIIKFMSDHEHNYENYLEENGIDNKISYEEYMLKETPDMFDELKQQGGLWSYGTDGCPPMIYDTLLEILLKYKFDIETVDIGSEGSNQIISVNPDRIKDIFLAEGLKHIQAKGEIDVTKD